MAWRKESDTPLWRGKDEIINILKSQQRRAAGGGFNWVGSGSIGCFGLICLFFASVLGRHAGPLWFMGWALVAAAVFTYFVMTKAAKQDPWQGHFWTLHIADGEAVFRCALDDHPTAAAPPEWVVSLDTVARVEIAQTAQYVPSRDYGRRGHEDDFRSVPEHEWQVFLFMTDGTRRVIYHANAARDDCAALAGSIRTYLETVRGAAPVVVVAPAAPVAGFDL